MQLLERIRPEPPEAGPLAAAEHCERLLGLFRRWGREAEALGCQLAIVEQQLEAKQQAERHQRLALVRHGPDRDSCDELQAHCDHLAEELSHLRLALLGTAAEIERTLPA